MQYCIKCGQPIQDVALFCPSCGAEITVTSAQQHNQQEQPYQQHTQTTTPNTDAEANKGMAIIAYILFFIPLLTGDHKKSDFVRYHTNQGTILFLFSAAMGIVTNILLAIMRPMFFNAFAFGAYSTMNTIFTLLWVAPTIFVILGIINASNGSMKPLPIIGDKFTIIK